MKHFEIKKLSSFSEPRGERWGVKREGEKLISTLSGSTDRKYKNKHPTNILPEPGGVYPVKFSHPNLSCKINRAQEVCEKTSRCIFFFPCFVTWSFYNSTGAMTAAGLFLSGVVCLWHQPTKTIDITGKKTTLESQDNTFTSPFGENI